MRPPVVYLDTQDFSRFGDVLRGKSDAATEALFLELERRKTAGEAIFAMSMPILGELLQYDAGFRETTIRKAEAVDRLCGGWALAFPSRLIAGEVAAAARQCGRVPDGPPIEQLSADRYWYPNVADAFAGLRGRIRDGIVPELSTFQLPRQQRRAAAKIARKMDVAAVAREAAPEMAAEYGLPVDVIVRSIVALLKGSITPAQASRRLFGAIAEPVKFVEAYFEKVETDRTLPAWISGFGRDFEARLAGIRDAILPFVHEDGARAQIDGLLGDWPAKLAPLALKMARDDVAEFGIDAALCDAFASDLELVELIPSARIVGHVLPAYVRQIVGLTGQEAKIEHSFGGDLVHALYLPHVDLWRGDRRFSGVISGAVPQYADRVVATPKALLPAIDAWNRAPGSLGGAA